MADLLDRWKREEEQAERAARLLDEQSDTRHEADETAGAFDIGAALASLQGMKTAVTTIVAEIDAAKAKHIAAHADRIRGFAELGPIEYDRIRVQEAERLGVRVGTLDKLVKDARRAEEDAAGGALDLPDTDPWPDPVDGAALLDDLAATFNHYAVLPAHADHALALWVLFSHAIDTARIAPLLAVTSPEKRCGKSTVLELVQRLARKPLAASNVSPAALFRAVEKWRPTLLIDEADTFLAGRDELRGIINSGHSRVSAFVVRTVGDDHEPRRFSTWGAKMIAMIGHLPDTLADRAIEVRLRRRLPGERIERLRHADPDQFERLARQCARFVLDHHDQIAAARPDLPEALGDRAQDNWEILMALADLAGGSWPDHARAAALALSGAEGEEPSVGVELLADIREVFAARQVDRLKTEDLLEALCESAEAPWVTYNRGKPISARQLAKRLKSFGVPTNQQIRFGARTARGYLLDKFREPFARYLSGPAHARGTKEQPSKNNRLDDFHAGTRTFGVPDEKQLNPLINKDCSSVPHTGTPPTCPRCLGDRDGCYCEAL